MDSIRDIIIQCGDDSQDWFPDMKADVGYFTICMAGEMGEFANLVKKAARGSEDPQDPEFQYMIAMELTDLFIYVCNMAYMLDVDLGETYDIKRAYNAVRFGDIGSDVRETESGVHRTVSAPPTNGGGGIRPDEIPGE